MGKKVRTKGRTSTKVYIRQSKASASDSISKEAEVEIDVTADISKKLDLELEADVEGVSNGGGSCKHFDQNRTEFKRVLLKIQSCSIDGRCEDCRDDPVNRRSKGKGKGAAKKKGGIVSSTGKKSEIFWVCLTCSHIGCRGGVEDSVPYGHARRHSKQGRHFLSARLDNPTIGWCLACDSNITIDVPHEPAPRLKDSSDDVMDARNIGGDFDENVGIVDAEIGYAVRGLVNLGNTCFFNSVMQNIFGIVKFREYFLSLTETVGPLTMSLKKLFTETNAGRMESNIGIVNPKNFFNCICSKASQFKGYQQQDSHELLRYLLDGLSTEEMSARKSRNSLDDDEIRLPMGSTYVEGIFGGQLSNTICCLECGHTSVVHEPFLDLSLPVPSKNVSPKKTLASFQKKNKFSREIQRARKGREKAGVKCSKVDRRKSNSVYEPSETREEQVKNQSPSVSEWSQCIVPACIQDQTASFPEECSTSSWLDFIEPSAEPDDGNLVSDQNENPNSQGSKVYVGLKDPEFGGICQTQNYYQTGESGLSPDGLHKEQAVSLECSGETNEGLLQTQHVEVEPLGESDDGLRLQVEGADLKSSVGRNESLKEAKVGSSVELEKVPLQAQGADFLSVPYTELVSTAENLTKTDLESQESVDNTALDNNPANKSSAADSPSVSCKPAEVEYDGVGDLFAEPDSTSVLGSGAATVEEADTSCLVGASSESNPEEIDDRNAPVSVDGCFAYFTKSELLTGDHAWQCENCSKILHQQKIKRWKRKQAIQNDDMHASVLDSLTETENITKIGTLSLDEKSFNFLKNGISAHSLDSNMVSAMESNRNNIMNGSASKDGMMCKENSELPENCHECSEKDGDDVVSNTSHYFSCTLNAEKTSTTDDSNCHNSNSCSRDGLNDNGNECEVQSLADNMEENCPTQLGSSTSITIQKMKGKMLVNGVKKSEEKEPEMVKVKRDATKRILINKMPPILTIHLVRFTQNYRGRLAKLNGHVSFPEILDLTPYLDETHQRNHGNEQYIFRLVGVVEHSGNMKGGHYVAYVRSEKGRRKGVGNKGGSGSTWFHTSDSNVREATLTEVLQSEAYILFYERIPN